MRDITFGADESTIERAREVARHENRTLDEAFREWLEWYASRNVCRLGPLRFVPHMQYARLKSPL
jgi:hypothetical protein